MDGLALPRGRDRLAALVTFLAVSTSPAQSTTLRVMPLGDSITESLTGYASYRYYLWKSLERGGYCVDFVGGRQGVRNGPPLYPDFDQDHEGVSGIRADQVAAAVRFWALFQQPDVVLVHLGTNDLWQGQSAASTVTDLGLVIDEIRASRPNVTIFLAQIIPAVNTGVFDVAALNAAIPGLVASKDRPDSRVFAVDHATGFDRATMLRDQVHPNDLGEHFMGDRWYAALQAFLPICVGSYRPLGAGCAGSQGVPTLSATGQGVPLLGQTFRAVVGNLPASAATPLGMLGFHTDFWNATPLPLDLTFFGMPGCVLHTDPGFDFPLVNQGGVANWDVPVPNANELIGLRLYQQCLVIDPSANARGMIVSDANAGIIGTR
jgi:lysophospholipase L1-like esterase